MSEEKNEQKNEVTETGEAGKKTGISKGVFIIIAVLALLVIGLGAYIIGDKTGKDSKKDNGSSQVASNEITADSKQDDKTEAFTADGKTTEKSTSSTIATETTEEKKESKRKNNPLFDSKSEIYLKVDDGNSWGSEGSFTRQYGIDICNNNKEAVKNWKITFSGFEGEVKVGDNWCGNFKLDNGTLSITPLDYNNEIPSGQSTNIGFMMIFDSEKASKTEPDIKLFVNGEEVTGGSSDKKNDKTTEKSDDKTTEKTDEKEDKTTESSGGSDKSNASAELYDKHGALKVDNVDLVDKDGKKIQLKGVSTHGIAWFPAYVNKDAFKTLRDEWGVNLIRLAMYTDEGMGYCTDGNKDDLKALIDKGVKAATELNMYVIIDWHILHDLTPLRYEDEAKDFFAEISEKYKDYGNVIYEICNEPNGGTSWSDVKKYAEDIIPIIRNNAPDAVIIVGTPNWSQEVDKAASDQLSFDNIMYAVHFYAATHKDDIRNKVKTARNAGAPVFISEFSICDASGNGGIDYSSAEEWMKYLDENDMSYAIWSLCNKDETSALISSSNEATSGWSYDDLSDAGKWYKDHLSK
ncbi:MAG: cellulase family glycosylhydrolase [Eubacterium sp.]|nr:cellulase family glycosylhydrolase [Eubacterium sp.]